jgi:hypothetical protein
MAHGWLHAGENGSCVRAWRDWWTTPTIVAGACVSIAFSWFSVELLGHYFTGEHHPGRQVSVVAHSVAYVFLALTLSIVVGSVNSAFQQGKRSALLVRVLTSYFCLMLVFASMYYEAAFLADFEDAVVKYDRYRHESDLGPPRLYRDQRAFSGIEPRFWSGVAWKVTDSVLVDGLPDTVSPATPAEMRATAISQPIGEVVQFLPSARLAIFADCLHFSVATMTTVGYGDITPRSVPARIAADCEAVCNTLLLIFGLGMIFGNWRGTAVPPPAPSKST